MSTVKQWILVVKQNWHFPREKLYKAAHLQTLHTSPAPAGWMEISGYTLHSLLFHWFTSSLWNILKYRFYTKSVSEGSTMHCPYYPDTILTAGLLQTCRVETNGSQMLRCPGGGGAKVVRVNTSVARLPRRHEMVPLLLLAAAVALVLAVSAAGTLPGNSGGEANRGSAGEEPWSGRDTGSA